MFGIFLPHTVDFSSLSKFKRSLNRVDLRMRSRSCFYIECVCFFCFYGQNVSASFLCLSCPALILVLIMCASSCSVDLSK